ncbi:hypothetical protein QFC20_004686 [Naganishia adeliensis]|uniref:Uncharacterized protein n=1 Tax=Naganishia adeliensis TaxID=92952 RepID=A0ACC2VX10_9TREE|nr:hypothetical protein QFC20_004686 [Naganishia adeliensis]
MQAPPEHTGSVIYDLAEGSEWRFELDEEEAVAVRVLSPDPVFINSQEIPPNTWYPLYGDVKGAIWSPLPGGKIEVSSAPSACYESTSSTLPFLTNLHLALERRRILARRAIRTRRARGKSPHLNGGGEGEGEDEAGPRLMVLGPGNAGKSTMVKNLVNLALGSGMGWAPAVVSLDPSNSPHLVPGSLSLSTPTQTAPTHHPSHFLGSPPTTSAATTLASDVPTLGWYLGTSELGGVGSQKTCFPLWSKIVRGMQDAWEQRREKDDICRASGVFIDTPSAMTIPTLGAPKGSAVRYGLVREAAEAFDVDVMVVVGNEKLTIEMQKMFTKNGVTVISAPKSGGNQKPTDENLFLRRTTAAFLAHRAAGANGRDGGKPASTFVYETAAPSSALPMGSTRVLSATRLTKVDPSAPANVHRLQNAVVGLVVVSDDDKLPDAVDGKTKNSSVKQEDAVETSEEPPVKEEPETESKTEDGATEEPKEEEIEDEDENDEPIWKEEIGWREVCGFLTITKIDTVKRKYELLTPSPGRLPSRVAIVGSVEWIEEM